MGNLFRKPSTERLADPKHERVRREHHDALVELQDTVRDMFEGPRMLGVAHLSMSANQTVSAANTTILLDTETANTVTSYVSHDSSGRIVIRPGATYRVTSSSYMAGTGEALTTQIYDITAGAYVGTCGYYPANDLGAAFSSAPIAAYVVKPTVATELDLRAQAITGTPAINKSYCWLSVEVFV